MLTRDERRALIFLAAVATAGGVIRVTKGAAAGPAVAAVAPDLPGEDIVRQASLTRQAQAASRALAPGERVDVDHAPAVELERLPRVGQRLAARIESDRQARGPFGSLAGLGRVPGVGAALLRDLAPYVTFGGVAPASVSPGSEFARASRPAAAAPAIADTARRSGLLVLAAPPGGRDRSARKTGALCPQPVSVNRATREELMCLPGIGPVLAGRIVAERDARGPFRDVSDLTRVPGIGPTRIERMKGRITIP